MKVVCLGLMVCDILVKPITKAVFDTDSERVDLVKMSSGGDAFNVAINLAKMGIRSGVIGKVGKDSFGDFLLQTAAEKSVDTHGVIITEQCGTSSSIVLIQPEGERHFAYFGGATDTIKESDVNLNIAQGAELLFIGSAFGLPGLDGEGMAHIMEKAQKLGMKTVLDVTCSPDRNSMKVLEPALRLTDIFLPSYEEAEGLTGKESPEEIADELSRYCKGIIGIKLGSKGCYIYSDKVGVNIPPFKVDAVDTTGAGDSFVSGFLTAYLKGWSLMECGRFANAAGALCVREAGATTGISSFGQVFEFMKGQSPVFIKEHAE